LRTYHPDYTKVGISRERYNELRAFCLQYPEWKSMASSLIGVGAQNYNPQPHAEGTVSDPVARLAEKRETLLKKIDLVEGVARKTGSGAWYSALIQNCCMGIALEYIDPVLMPTSHRNEFYRRRREFYVRLDQALDFGPGEN